MSDFTHKISEAMEMFSEDLVVGNHDSVTLFGVYAQNRLGDYSRKVTTMLLKDTEDLDLAISETLKEIEIFEQKTKNPIKSIWGRQFYRKEILKEFTKLLSYIDNMVLYFKLQQTQLLKEVKLLEKLAEKIIICTEELEKCIAIGKETLLEKNTEIKCENNDYMYKTMESETEVWYKRLEKRIDDLSVSHTISMQNYVQIKLLRDNNLVMLDKIAGAIANTFPIWQNQMALMLGIELLESRMEIQEKILSMGENNKNLISTKIKIRGDLPVDEGKLKELNESLTKVLDEMTMLEEETMLIRKNIVNSYVL